MTPSSFVRLGWYFARQLVVRLFRRRGGLARFEESYAPDGLFAVAQDEREAIASLSRCIACGVCDTHFGSYDLVARNAMRGPSDFVLSQSRSLPDWDALVVPIAQLERGALARIELLCPVDIPFAKVAAVAKKRAEQLRAARAADASRLLPRSARGDQASRHDPG